MSVCVLFGVNLKLTTYRTKMMSNKSKRRLIVWMKLLFPHRCLRLLFFMIAKELLPHKKSFFGVKKLFQPTDYNHVIKCIFCCLITIF